ENQGKRSQREEEQKSASLAPDGLLSIPTCYCRATALVDASSGAPSRMPIECHHVGCTNLPSYGVACTTTAEFCSGHAEDGMVDVHSKNCAHCGCTKQPRYGVAGTTTAEFCTGHAKDGMVDVHSKKCTHRGCTKRPKYGVAGAKTVEF
ncbi:unnamed protein product, partial [Pylaiella littoralis]